MKTSVRWILVTIVLGVVFHLITVRLYPNIIMGLIMNRVKVLYGGVNRLMHAPPTTSESRRVVRPSPDLLYSACVYDVSKGPIKITTKVPDTYWSISFYRTNTDNFFVKNDRQVQSKEVIFILKQKGQPHPDINDAEVIEAPTDTGFLIIRMLVEDDSKIGKLIEVQRQAVCEPI